MKWRLLSFLVLIMLLSILAAACSNKSDTRINDPVNEGTNGQDTQIGQVVPEIQNIFFDPEIKKNVYLEGKNMGGLKASEVRERIRKAAEKMYVAPENAELDPKSLEFLSI